MASKTARPGQLGEQRGHVAHVDAERQDDGQISTERCRFVMAG